MFDLIDFSQGFLIVFAPALMAMARTTVLLAFGWRLMFVCALSSCILVVIGNGWPYVTGAAIMWVFYMVVIRLTLLKWRIIVVTPQEQRRRVASILKRAQEQLRQGTQT